MKHSWHSYADAGQILVVIAVVAVIIMFGISLCR